MGYMHSIFQYTVAYCMPKWSKISYTWTYMGYMHSIFQYTEAYRRPK